MRIFIKLWISVLVFPAVLASLQGQTNPVADSLLEQLAETEKKSDKVVLLNHISRAYLMDSIKNSRQYADEAIRLAKKINNKEELAKAWNNMSLSYYFTGEFQKALQYNTRALNSLKETDDNIFIWEVYHNCGLIYIKLSDSRNAIPAINEAIRIAKSMGDSYRLAAEYINMGLAWKKIGDYSKGIEYYQKCLEIYKDNKELNKSGSVFINIGVLYKQMGKHKEALHYYKTALQYFSDEEKYLVLSTLYNNMGKLFFATNQYDSALIYHNKSLKIQKQSQNKQEEVLTYLGISNVHDRVGDFYQALDYRNKALALSVELGDKLLTAQSYYAAAISHIQISEFDKAEAYLLNALKILDTVQNPIVKKDILIGLMELYRNTGDYKKALEYHIQYKSCSDSLLSKETSNQLARFHVEYETMKKKNEISLLRKDNKIQELEVKKQKSTRNAFIAGFILVLILALVLFSLFRIKRKTNKALILKNEKIQQQKEEILTQNEEIMQQKEEILSQAEYLDQVNRELTMKNKKITDSIAYAKRIQDAILPSEEAVQKAFPRSFIFYKPREIVSGDFYWYREKGVYRFFTVADCTGHGVPGAFMSMIGNTLLNEIIGENILNPADILSELNKRIVYALSQSGGMQEDGMDISLCRFDSKKKEIIISLANHTALYLEAGELKTVEGDLFPVGGSIFNKNDDNYTNHTIHYQSGINLYMFSDGFLDQFGSVNLAGKEKKYSNKRFSQLINDISAKPMEEQKQIFVTEFENWKGGRKQLDDVLVAGIKLP